MAGRPRKNVDDLKAEVKAHADCKAYLQVCYPNHYRETGNSLCMAHEDTNESLQVSKDFAYCHACGKHFDVIELHRLRYGSDYKTAVLELAEHYGIPIEKPSTKERAPKGKPKLVRHFSYESEDGKVLYQTERKDYGPGVDKDILQRSPDPERPGEWRYTLKDVRLVPYRLPAMIASQEIWIVEGEQCADDLASLGLSGTTTPLGAGKWPKLCREHGMQKHFEGKDCYILPDNDGPGEKHAEDICRSLVGIARTLKRIQLPGLPPKGDVSDFIEQHSPEEARRLLLELADATPKYNPESQRISSVQQADTPGDDEEKKPSKFQKALHTFLGTGSQVFLDQHQTGWAAVDRGGYLENIRLTSGQFTRYLLKLFVDTHGEEVSRETISQVADYLEASATETRQLNNRFAWRDGTLFIDMGTPTWDSIKVTADGYEIVRLEAPPFQRYSHQKPLPTPEPGGDLREVLGFLPVKDEDSQILLMVWLVTALLEHIPRPILSTFGIQGSGKSTLCEFTRNLLDPSSTLTPSMSKDHSEFIQLLSHHAVVCLDNIHRIPQWGSDDLCRAVTAGGFSKRRLYSDDDDIIYQFSRCIILNGINVPGTSPDLLDRSILIQAERISKEERRDKTALCAQFNQARGRIFGAVLNALSRAIAIVDTVELSEKPRMADWAVWGCAVAEALGIGQERFLQAYYRNIGSQNDEIVNSEPTCVALAEFMREQERWTGTPSELYSKLTDIAENEGLDKEKRWPKASNGLSRKLRELQHNLQEAGMRVEMGYRGRGRNKKRSVTISWTERVPEISSTPSDRPQATGEAPWREDDTGTIPTTSANTVPDIDPHNPPKSLDGKAVDDGDGFCGTPGGDLKGKLERFGCPDCQWFPGNGSRTCAYCDPPLILSDESATCPKLSADGALLEQDELPLALSERF